MKEVSRSRVFGPGTKYEEVRTRRLVRIEGLCEGTVDCMHPRDSGKGTLCVRSFVHYEHDGEIIPGYYLQGSLSLIQ